MQRETLSKILDRVPGVSRKGESYRIAEGAELSFYVGEPGRAMILNHVQEVTLLDTHVEIMARDRGTLYTVFEAIHAVQGGEPQKKGHKRAGLGFSS